LVYVDHIEQNKNNNWHCNFALLNRIVSTASEDIIPSPHKNMESLRQVTSSSSVVAVLLATLAALVVLDSFSSVDLVPQAAAFSKPSIPLYRVVTTSLFAEGAPQYQKHDGVLQQSECVGKGSYLLTIDYNDEGGKGGDDYPAYEPGHVLALEIKPPSGDESTESGQEEESSSTMTTMTEKTKKDLEKNDGWLRGPYTVSFGYGGVDDNSDTNGNTNDGFKVLVKEVGYKSHVFATSKPGTPVLFGGKFKVPIAKGIVTAAEAVDDDNSDNENRGETKRVVMISSGVGVGPCIGAVEELLQSPSSSSDKETIVSIDLIASYRTREEVSMDSALEKLQTKSTDGDAASKKPDFHWKPVITSEGGRLSSNGPESLREDYLRSSSSSSSSVSAVKNTHYHIIGNGQLVNEWKEGLKKAGVPSARITVEAYFNHSEEPDPSAIDTICEAILGLGTADETTKTTEKAEETTVSL
jgi:ferredoxin-NADP reductase